MGEELLLQIDNEKDDLYDKIIKTNINDRKIVLNKEVDDSLIEDIVLWILEWNKQDKDIPVENRKKIYLYLSSDGGDCVSGSFLLSVIKASKTPIVTVGMAKCASMASYILASGHERIAFSSTIVLMHDGSVAYSATGSKSKDIQKFYDELDKRLTKFMIDNSSMDSEFMEEIKDREYYIFAEKAKELGIIDKIIGVDCDITEIL